MVALKPIECCLSYSPEPKITQLCAKIKITYLEDQAKQFQFGGDTSNSS